MVVGLYECIADDDDELGFDEGDLLDVLEVISEEWFQGRSQKTGKEGMVPFNYVELHQVQPEPTPQTPEPTPQQPPPQPTPAPGSSSPVVSPAATSSPSLGPTTSGNLGIPKMSSLSRSSSSAPMNNPGGFSLLGGDSPPQMPMTARNRRNTFRIAPKSSLGASPLSDVLSPYSFEDDAYKKLRPSDCLHAQKAAIAKLLEELYQSPSPLLQPLAAWWQPRPSCVLHHKTPKKSATWKEGTPTNLTKERINDFLCGKETLEEEVLEAIVLSHSSLMTSVNFFDLLTSGYHDAVATNDMNKRSRACLVLRIWITEFRHDFSEASLFLLLDKFLSQLDREVPCDLTLSAQAKTNEPFYLSRRHWEKQIRTAFSPLSESEPKPFEPKDMAEHLTVWEWGLQMSFRSSEVLEGTHPLSSSHFERLAEWVRDRISYAENLEESFAFFCEVLCVCMDLLNFSSVHAILCGFTLSGMDPRNYLPKDTSINVIDPLYKLFGDPSNGIESSFHVLQWFLDGRVAFLPSHMLVTKEVVQISGNAKPNENRGLDLKRVFEILRVHLAHVRNALILPDKYQFETEYCSSFLYLLDPSVCHELASVEEGLAPGDMVAPQLTKEKKKQADTDEHGLVLCSGGFDLEPVRDNINIDAENQMPLVDPTYNDPVFFRDFYDNSSPSIYFTEVDAQGRPFVVAMKTYTSPKSLQQKGMACVFTSLSIGEGNPVNHTIKGMDKGLLENDKKLAGVLVSLLSAVLPFLPKQKLSLRQINPTNNLLDHVLRLETISMCPRPHRFAIVHHSNLQSKHISDDEGEETPAFAAFVNALVGAPKDSSSFNTTTTIQFSEIDVRYVVTRRLSPQDRAKTLDEMPVAIVFCEGKSTPFSPMDFPHSTMMFIFVSPNGQGGYKVAVVSKDNIHSCSPKVSASYTPEQMAAFVTSKAINADRRAFRIVPQIWRKADGERVELLQLIASSAGDQEDNVSKARKRASTALQGVVVGGLKRGPVQSGTGQAACAPSGPVPLSDSAKAIGILRLCFLPDQSKKKGSSRKTKEFLQNLPALSSPLQLDSSAVEPSAHPGMTFTTLNALCQIIEGSKDYKQLFVNPHLKEVSEVLGVIDKSGVNSSNTSYLKKFSSRVLAGVLRLWIIHSEGSVVPSATYKGLVNLVIDDRIGSNSPQKINTLLDTLPETNYAIFERIIRMFSQLAKGSVTASGLLAESFAVLLFLPLAPNLDLLINVRAQKLVLQTCIDHYSTIFTKKVSSPSSSTPLMLVEKASAKSVKISTKSSSSKGDLKGSGESKPKKKPGFKSLAKSVGKSSTKKDSLKESNPSGDYAKVFNLKDHCGKKVHLAKYVAQGTRLILFFYSRDHTSKSVLKLFKTNYDLFTANGCQVFGITSGKTADDVSSMRLPFALLSDSSNRTRQKYGVSSSKNATFVLNECGEIVHSFDSSDSVVEHILHAMYGVVLQTGGFYLRSNARHPSHHFEYFYDLTGEMKEEEAQEAGGLGVAGWDVGRVLGWLEENGLVDLAGLFEENMLNGTDLLDLEMKELEVDLKLEGDPLLPTLIAEINDLRVENAKSALELKK